MQQREIPHKICALFLFLHLDCSWKVRVCVHACVRAGCRRTGKAFSVPLLLRPDGRKIKRKRTDYHSTITSLHCTTKAHPSIPAVGEREERTALTTTTTTTNRQWGEHRWEEGGKEWEGGEGEEGRGGGGKGKGRFLADERGEVLLPSDGEV